MADLPPIYDAFTLHQVHVEKLKLGAAAIFAPFLRAIILAFKRAFAALRVRTLAGLPKGQVMAMAVQLVQQYAAQFTRYAGKVGSYLQRFLQIETSTVTSLMQEFFPDVAPDPAPTQKTMWARASNAIVPAFGATITNALSNLAGYAQAALNKSVMIGYANKLPVSDIVAALDKTSQTIARNAQSTIGTAIQFVSGAAIQNVSSLYVSYYQYVAVLDDRTTDICRSLDGKVFAYGEGPVPPQHIGCRSTIIPVENDNNPYPVIDFSDWVSDQPASIQDEVAA